MNSSYRINGTSWLGILFIIVLFPTYDQF